MEADPATGGRQKRAFCKILDIFASGKSILRGLYWKIISDQDLRRPAVFQIDKNNKITYSNQFEQLAVS